MRSGKEVVAFVGIGVLAACFVDPGVAPTTAASSSSTGETASSGTTTTTTTTTDVTTTTTDVTTDVTTVAPTSGSDTSTSGVSATTEALTTEVSTGSGSSTGGPEGVPACERLYFTDFTEEPVELNFTGEWMWDALAGEMIVAGHPLLLASAWINMGGWTDVMVATRVRIESGTGNASVRARTGTLSHYSLGVRFEQDAVRIGRLSQGVSTILDGAPGDVQQGEWYVISIRVKGQMITGAGAGAALAVSDTELASGNASIGMYGEGVARFDWFLVCPA